MAHSLILLSTFEMPVFLLLLGVIASGGLLLFSVYRFVTNLLHPLEPPPVDPQITDMPSISTHPHRLSGILSVSLLCVVGMGYVLVRLITQTPTVTAFQVNPDFTNDPTSSPPIIITTNVPINPSLVRINVSSPTALAIKPTKLLGFLPLTREFTVMPKTSFPPQQQILLYISNMKNPFSAENGSEKLYEFETPSIPQIISSTPIHRATDISPNAPIVFNLDVTDQPYILWNVESSPSHEFRISRSPRSLTLTPTSPLQQNTTYAFTILRTVATVQSSTHAVIERYEPSIAHVLSFTTVKAPLVTAVSPSQTFIRPTDPIRITFDTAIDPTSATDAILFSPPNKRKLVWDKNNTVLTIEGAPLGKDIDVLLTLKKGLKTKAGGTLSADNVFHFHSYGTIALTDSTPKADQVNVSTQKDITLTFNQETDPAQAKNFISFSPPVSYILSGEGSSLKIHPQPQLAFSTHYTLTIASGLPGLYGQNGQKTITIPFTTEPKESSLNVPYFKQEELFTCNIAVARMLLAYHGVSKTEQELKTEIGINGSRGNGNPHKGYTSEYGTYWEPINAMLSHYGKTTVLTQATLEQILTLVQNGTPVMVWSQNGWSAPTDISWKTPDGIQIHAINGMHSYIVRGWQGSLSSPSSILVLDPWRGSYAMETSRFLSLWSYFNVALVLQ